MDEMDRKNFIKRAEDFVCENCGHRVYGTGFTNHCPKCLFSKHVDNIPGDRDNVCNGMMKPMRLEFKKGLPHQVVHRCLKCGAIKKNEVAQDDNKDILVDLPH